MTTLDEAPVRREDLVVHELEGECVVFVPRTGDLHRLNQSAALVWNLLEPGVPLRLTVAEIAEATNADHHVVEGDVLELVGRFRQLGLLRESSVPTAEGRDLA